jgi:hypothetical protein
MQRGRYSDRKEKNRYTSCVYPDKTATNARSGEIVRGSFVHDYKNRRTTGAATTKRGATSNRQMDRNHKIQNNRRNQGPR